jgi:hypothetical protein
MRIFNVSILAMVLLSCAACTTPTPYRAMKPRLCPDCFGYRVERHTDGTYGVEFRGNKATSKSIVVIYASQAALESCRADNYRYARMIRDKGLQERDPLGGTERTVTIPSQLTSNTPVSAPGTSQVRMVIPGWTRTETVEAMPYASFSFECTNEGGNSLPPY